MHLIDTHAHLDDLKFGQDRDSVIRSAVEAGVVQIVTIGTDLASSAEAIALADRYPNVYATVGVHPHSAASLDPAALDELRELAAHSLVVGIGETGLDFYRDLSPRSAQRDAFAAHLALSAQVGKPIVVHVRDKRGETAAYDEALDLLAAWVSSPLLALGRRGSNDPPSSPGVLHCFSGDLQMAQSALDLGLCIGIDGPVTYPSARTLQTTVAQLPLRQLVLETDCPYLTPQPRRGRRNEPAYLCYVAQRVAELKGMDAQTVASTTTENARCLFGLPAAEPGH